MRSGKIFYLSALIAVLIMTLSAGNVAAQTQSDSTRSSTSLTEALSSLSELLGDNSFTRTEKALPLERTYRSSYTTENFDQCIIRFKMESTISNAHNVLKEINVVDEVTMPLGDIDLSSIHSVVTPMYSYESGRAAKAEPMVYVSFDTLDHAKTIKTTQSTVLTDHQGKPVSFTNVRGDSREVKSGTASEFSLLVKDEADGTKLADAFKTAVKLCKVPSN